MTNAKSKNRLAPIGGGSVVDRTIETITDAIMDGRYKVGQKLPNEYELIKELQISRNSLREAIRVLGTLGIVEVRRGDGTYVCEQIKPSIFDNIVYGLMFDASSSAELIELRESLDELMLKIAVNKATEDDVKALETLVSMMSENFAKGDMAAAATADYNFHMKMADICRNKLLSRIIEGVYQFFKDSIQDNISTEEEYAHADEYHRNIIEIIKTRDRSRIQEVIETSLETWRNKIKQ